jgi:SAM-dependent methyltransferase
VNRETAREWTHELSRKYLQGEPDAYSTFLHLAETSCPEGGRVVDLGCGEEEYLTYLIDKAGEIIGIDSKVMEGPYHRYIEADLNLELPLEQGSVDLAASKFLLEHLDRPAQFLKQAFRILRPGGSLVLMTPNILYYPYSINYLLSRCMLQERRMRLVEQVTGRPQEDVFPVHYRCNTPSKVKRWLMQAGFEVTHLQTYSDYLVSAFNRPLGAIAVAYEKGINTLSLKGLKGFIVAEARKCRDEHTELL